MIKIITIIGARPQIIKAAAISRAIRNSFSNQIEEIIVHTGQHYDANMSDVFFEELQISKPKYNLNVGSMSHAKQSAAMLSGIEEILVNEKPNALLVYGDTNSTLAGAIAASKIHIPVVHIEAGLRSFNKAMPEEINRIVTDHTSTMLFCPTKTAINNLKNEGFNVSGIDEQKATIDKPHTYYCGDVMYDNTLHFSDISEKENYMFEKHNINKHNYILATIHRPSNTDDATRLQDIFESLVLVATKHKTTIVLPLHPRTAAILEKSLPQDLLSEIKNNEKIILLEPLSFLQMLLLEKNAKLIMTDSGGVQKEAYFLNKPAVVLRSETEWVEIVEEGAARVVDANKQAIIDAADYFIGNENINYPNVFGDGKSSEFICKMMVDNL